MALNKILYFSLLFVTLCSCAQEKTENVESEKIVNGDARIEYYLPFIKAKRVAIVANHTSIVDSVNIVDTLKNLGVDVRAIFSPEHGFTCNANAGEKVSDSFYRDIKVYSLYGKNRKPTSEQLENIDVVLYDLQDVGVRFFTYISTLHYVMESCAEANIPLVVLDRPNPHGDEIDGPVLEKELKSFVGMHPIPILYGFTVGELACMISGENWLESSNRLDLKIVEMLDYDPHKRHKIHFSPSPNLRSDVAIALYPSLCLFEATNISVGRGTENPFTIIGAPEKKFGNFVFTPKPDFGDKNPLHNGEKCYGKNLICDADSAFTLKYFLEFYEKSDSKSFWKNAKFFDLLCGTKILREQIENGISEDSIRRSWEKDIENYKNIRQKYILYDEKPIFSEIDWEKEMYSSEVDSLLFSMTLDEKIGQLIWITLNGWPQERDFAWVERQCVENGIGGVLIMQCNDCRKIRNFIESLQEKTKIPVIFSMDAETGAGRKLEDIRNFPLNKYLSSFDSLTIKKIGEIYAHQLKTVGIDVNFAPVVDVNTNPKNPVIGSRSFGSDARKVSDCSRQLVVGMQSQGCVATLKHYPGHGDTHSDSHTSLPVITNSRKHVDEIDLLPFRENIRSGAMAVMTAHIAVPALDLSEKVASLSRKMIVDLLRKEMNFEGLIVSDAMNMAGIKISAGGRNAESEAIIAGNDVVEFCLDVPLAIKSIRKALSDNRLTEEDLEEKVRRVLAVKKWCGTLDRRVLFGAPEVKMNSLEVEILIDQLTK